MIAISATEPAMARTRSMAATVVRLQSDPNAANNTASASTQVSAAAKSVDLAVTKTGPAAATTGGPIASSQDRRVEGAGRAPGAPDTASATPGVVLLAGLHHPGSWSDPP